ncbi:MAG TPA: hypothetical protein VJ752_12700 [Burkholderiaceae bacterium]|nr:hypothetical protein [Burkholderiaceae bacterium]
MRVLDYIIRVIAKRATASLTHVLTSRRRLQLGPEVGLYPDFLYPERDGRAVPGKERRFYASNDAVRITVADGELWIFPCGHQLLLPRLRK